MSANVSNIWLRIRKKIREQMNLLYLRLSDCDGMCDHCDPELKENCYQRKGRTEEDDQREKTTGSHLKY